MRHFLFAATAGLVLASLATASAITPKKAPAPVNSAVVNLAPDFVIPGAGGKPRTLRSLKGQAVVILFAKSIKTRDLKAQVKKLQPLFEQFASKDAVFVVALKEGDALIQSNIPFAEVANGPAVCAAYGVQRDFAIGIVGKDGNLDYITNKVLVPERVRDVIQNSFAVQASLRKNP